MSDNILELDDTTARTIIFNKSISYCLFVEPLRYRAYSEVTFWLAALIVRTGLALFSLEGFTSRRALCGTSGTKPIYAPWRLSLTLSDSDRSMSRTLSKMYLIAFFLFIS